MAIAELLGGAASGSANIGAGYGASRAGQDALSQSTALANADLERLSAWQKSGTAAADQINALLGLGGDQTAAMAKFQTDPGYKFRMQQGVNALDRSAASRGTTLSGAQSKALNDYGQNTGSAEYGNYFNRLTDVSGKGLTAANYGNMAVNQAMIPGINAAFQGSAAQNAYNVAGANAQAAGLLGAQNSLLTIAGAYGPPSIPSNMFSFGGGGSSSGSSGSSSSSAGAGLSSLGALAAFA